MTANDSASGPKDPVAHGLLYAHVPVPRASILPPPLSAPADAATGPGGVRFELLKQGTGDQPGPLDTIIVDYSMWTGDGQLALSSYTEREATPFSVSSIAAPLRSMLTSLRTGAKARYWIPRAALQGWKPDRWPDADLIIEVELLRVTHVESVTDSNGNHVTPNPVRAPDAAGPPTAALTTPAGLRFIQLTQSQSSQRPKPSDRLDLTLDAYAVNGLTVSEVVHDLKSATLLGRAPANLDQVLSQMSPGDQVRVWLPAGLGKQVVPQVGDSESILDMTLDF